MVQLKVASMFFFSGLAVVIALVVVVYVVAWVYDRASGTSDGILTLAELEERRVASTLVKDAGLAGLLPDEKNRVLRHFFQESSKACIKQYSSSDIEAPYDRFSSKEADSGDKSGVRDEKRKSSVSEITKNADTSMIIHSESESCSKKYKCTNDIAANCTTKSKDEKSKSKPKHGYSSCDDSNDLDQASKGAQSITDKDHKNRELDENETSKRHGKDMEFADGDAEKETEEGVCPICLVEFANDENIIIGNCCGHVFHFECFMQWVEKNHTDCPLCRSDMMTPENFLASAYEVLGEQRVSKLKHINEEAARRLAAWEASHPERIIQEESSPADPVEPSVRRDPPARMAPLATADTSRLTVVMVQ